MDNQIDVILKSVAPVISFDFLDDPEDKGSLSTDVPEDTLKAVLSNGERRALYILNIIFEVEARRTSGEDTLFLIDDIADSFDYRNKYAIVEYLNDLGDNEHFRQIILTHNFDFYRTVSGRLNIHDKARMLTNRANGEIKLEREIYQRSAPFKNWRSRLGEDLILVASIPFLRNLAEFSGDKASFMALTSLLHIKADSNAIFIGTLEDVIKVILKDAGTLSLQNPGRLVLDLIHSTALGLAADGKETAALEEKVALSIGIRLKAEEFMIAKINDKPFWEGIKRNQTIELVRRYRADFPTEKETIRLLDQVNLMTPENIHLNSFMYEPILDLSAHHLKKLYQKVSGLK